MIVGNVWDDYKALPEVQFFAHYWWLELLLLLALFIVCEVVVLYRARRGTEPSPARRGVLRDRDHGSMARDQTHVAEGR